VRGIVAQSSLVIRLYNKTRVRAGTVSAAASGGPEEPVFSRSLSEQLSRRLVLRIVGAEFESGSPLPSEKDLAKHYRVSRTVVREAVKEIEMLGLIKRHQGRLTRIAPSSEWHHLTPALLSARAEVGAIEDLLLELLELRRIVELEAAALAAGRATQDDLQAMKVQLELMDNSMSNTAAFAEQDIAFHDAVLVATRNTLLAPLFAQLRPLLEFGRAISADARGGRPESQRGHRAIYAAIASNDAEAARAAMSEHLSWTATLEFTEREKRLRAVAQLEP
jgi:DNA-binding FadR family transcriptional regulator